MAQIVFAEIDSIQKLASAQWVAGNQNSYEDTKAMTRGDYNVTLIGRRTEAGSVQVVFARAPRAKWQPVNNWHVELAGFFEAALEQHTIVNNTLKPFIDTALPEKLANAVRQLVASEVGASASADDNKDALNQIGAALRAMGVPAGDWTFVPMLRALA